MLPLFSIRESLSHPAHACNEDAFGHAVSGETLDLWVIDGATSVADREYLGLDVSDPAWFAQSLSRYFQDHITADTAPPVIVRRALGEISGAFLDKTRDMDVPVYAWPMAALLWVRVCRTGNAAHIDIWSMGDSRALIRADNGEIVVFPALQRGDVTPVQTAAGTAAPPAARSRTGVLLSQLEKIRVNRTRQHTVPEENRMGFHPDSIDHADRLSLTMTGDFDLLAMSDGLYRLVDDYRLYDDDALLRAADGAGLAALYDRLRAHEAANEDARAIKSSDDATGVLVRVGG